MKRVESIEVGRPIGFTQPQAIQPFMEKKSSVPAARFEERRVVERVSPQREFSNPPQVVESVNFARPAERTATSKIIDNLQGNYIIEKQGDSLVTSSPSGYDNRLQQERVISQTYTIKEESNLREDEPAFKVKELKGSETDWQAYTKNDTRDNATFGVTEEPKYEYKGTSSFVPSEDGKSSPDFLAFLNEIRAGASKTTPTDTYSYVNSSPSYTAEN